MCPSIFSLKVLLENGLLQFELKIELELKFELEF